jgi:3-methyladenine DNA glycosylase AlkD
MTVKEALAKLKALGDEKVRKQNRKYGAGDEQFGVKHGDIRKLAKFIKTNHALALELWDTGNCDAQLLAVLLMDPTSLSPAALERLVRSISFAHVADWLNSYVVKNHADKEKLRLKWLAAKDRWTARAGWFLMSSRINARAEGSTFLPCSIGSNRKCPVPRPRCSGP